MEKTRKQRSLKQKLLLYGLPLVAFGITLAISRSPEAAYVFRQALGLAFSFPAIVALVTYLIIRKRLK